MAQIFLTVKHDYTKIFLDIGNHYSYYTPMNLLKETLRLLKKSEKQGLAKREIAKKARVSVRWINKLLSDQSVNPSIHEVQRLYDALNAEINQ